MLTTTRTVGPYTIERKLGTGGIAESFLGSPTAGDGPQVVIRRVLPFVCADPQRLAATEARVRDLIAIRHPFLVPVVDWLSLGRERFIVEEHVPGETLTRLLEARRQLGKPLPPNVFLNLATQICNGLEALHGRPGTASGGPQVLHLGLRPDAILVTPEGKVVLGSYGLVRSPTLLPHGGVTAPSPGQLRYLAPEQTLSDATLSAASDIFSLGSILFELTTNRVLFDAGSNLRTIHAVRRADVATQLQTVRERIPGLDRVLTRALAQNPRFRYNRAFVLREDLRGLMASYSFSTVNEDTRAVLDSARTTRRLEPAPAAPSPKPQERLLAEAPQPHLSAGQAETLHTHKGIEEGLFEDTRHSGGPPPLVTDEQPVHQRPNLAAQLATPEPTPAAPPSKFEPTIPDLSVDPATPSEDETPLFEDDILADPGFAPHAESDYSDDDVPWDPPKSARVSTPEDLPEAPTALPPQPALLSPTPAAAGGTAAFQRSAPASSSAPLAPPPPSGALPDTPTLPPAPHAPAPAPVLDSSGRPVAPNDTAFIPAPPARLAPPSAGTPNEPPPLLRPPMPPAPAAPASAEDTAFFAAPLPPASAPPPAELPSLRPPPPLPPAPAQPAPSDVPQLPRELSGVPQPPPAFDTPPSAPGNVPPPAATAPPPPVQAPPPASPTALPSPAIAPDAVPSPMALEAAAALPTPPALLAPPSPPARPAPPPPAAVDRPAPVAASAPVVEPLRPSAAPPSKPAEQSSKAILAVGVAAAAIALVFCAGLGGYVVRQGDTPGPTVATAIDEPSEAVAAVVEQDPPAKSPEFAAEDTGQPAVAQTTSPPKARPPKSTTSRSARASRSEPRSAPSARRARPPRIPTPALPTAPRAAAPSAPEPGLEDARDDASVDLDRAARSASAGGLDPSTRRSLEAKAIDDPDYTQARTILAVDAAQRGDVASAERYLEQTMSLPENRYNPVLLSQLALHQVNRQRYATALSNANRAEQHWARLPSNVMYERKAIIYEVQAAATQGLLYEAESDQQQKELVNDALRRWTRFREHATSGSSIDQIARADRQIEKLTSIRARLE